MTRLDSTTKSQLSPVEGPASRPDPGVAQVKVRSSVSTKTSANVISIIPLNAIVSFGCAEATADRSEASSDTTKSACEGQALGAATANDGRSAVGATLPSWQATTTARRSKGVMLNARFMRVLPLLSNGLGALGR